MGRVLSDAAVRDAIEIDGAQWDLVPSHLQDVGMFVAETFPVARQLVPGVWGAVEAERRICRLSPEYTLQRVVANRYRRSERGAALRLRLSREAEAKRKAERFEAVEHEMRADLRKVLKNSTTMAWWNDGGLPSPVGGSD